MWYSEVDKKTNYDNAQLEAKILTSKKRVFFIDGPSTCGKTHFARNMREQSAIIYPMHLLLEELMATVKDNIPDSSIYRRIESMFPCQILFFDDADMSLAGKSATQQEIAHIAQRLSEKRQIVFLGISMKKRCDTLLKTIGEGSYEYFLFDEKPTHTKEGNINKMAHRDKNSSVGCEKSVVTML